MSKRKREVDETKKVKFKGVKKNGTRFEAKIYIDGKNTYLGRFDTPKEAAQAFDRAAIQAGHPTSKLNFLDQVPQNYKAKKTRLYSTNKTGFRGVQKRGKRFRAGIKIDGTVQYIGSFDTKKEAAIAWDLAAIQANRSTSDLNFPDMIMTKRTINKVPINKINIIKNNKKKNGKSNTTTTKSNNNSSSKTKTGRGGYASKEFPEKSTKKTGRKVLREFPEAPKR